MHLNVSEGVNSLPRKSLACETTLLQYSEYFSGGKNFVAFVVERRNTRFLHTKQLLEQAMPINAVAIWNRFIEVSWQLPVLLIILPEHLHVTNIAYYCSNH